VPLLDRLRFLVPSRFRPRRVVVPVVRLTGVIGAAMPLRQGLTIQAAAQALERAFSWRDASAVAIVVNSPGGSPVQSHLIYKRIRALALEKKRTVFVFVEDAAASGGYMIACAGDEIFADPSSIVGSIGVVSSGFGFEKLIERIGVERRVHTAGRSKAMLDPFRPENPDDIVRLKAIQGRIHDMFVALVEGRRDGRLKGDRDDLFSGRVWSGDEALELGLVDGMGDLRSVLRERFGDKVVTPLVPIGSTSLLAKFLGRPPTIRSLVDPADLVAAAEERAAWARIGL
jgi:signal peptide peptidase SppA